MSHQNSDWVPTVLGAGRHRATDALAELAAIMPAWMTDGSCSQADPEAWFPEQGASSAMAKKICADCPVRVPCLRYAIDNNERIGTWGGLTASERQRLVKEAS